MAGCKPGCAALYLVLTALHPYPPRGVAGDAPRAFFVFPLFKRRQYTTPEAHNIALPTKKPIAITSERTR